MTTLNDITFHIYSSSQIKKDYPKNSFDRFGDDLTELILTYLTFEDKVRLECVSKQWRRLVYNKQFVIEISDKTYYSENDKNNSLEKLYRRFGNRRQLDEQSVESVLKKCPNIKKVIILGEVSSEVLSLIGQYCTNIKSLSFLIDLIECLDFFPNYGHKLEELIIQEFYDYWNTDDIRRVLELCPNLKKVQCNRVLGYMNEDKDFLPKLEFVGNIIISSEEVNELKILSDKYSQTMKTLELSFNYISYEEMKTCFECIVRFENLKELKLKLLFDTITEPIDDCLSLIGQKCNKLLKLHLSIYFHLSISDKFFHIFTQFKALKKLKIILYFNTVLSGSVECFKHCKQLIDVYISYKELREDFFANIAKFLPKLQSLNIYTSKRYSDSFINSFLQMKDIQRVELRDNNGFFPKIWNFRKCLTEIMLSPNGKHVIRVNDYCGKIDFNYVRYCQENSDIYDK